MVRLFKNCLYSWVFTAAIFSFLSNIDVEARSRSSVSLSCDESKLPYKCSDGAKHTISDKVYQLVKSSKEENGQDISLTSSAVIVAQQSNTIIQANRVQISGIEGVEDTYGVIASQGGKVVLSDSTLKDVSTGLRAESGTIEVNRGLVKATQVGIYAEKQGTSVLLTNAEIKVESQDIGQKAALFSGNDAVIKMKGGSIDVTDAAALYLGVSGSATLDGVTITSKSQQEMDKENANKEDGVAYAVLNVNQHGAISLKNTNVIATGVRALWIGLDANAQSSMGQEANISVSRVNIEDSKIIVSGNKHGMHFDMDKEDNEYQKGFVFLKKTTFEVPDGTAIHSYKSSGYIGVTEGTKISGDLLLTAEKESSVAILVDSSSLTGGTRVADDSIAELYLTGGSKWVLTKSKEINQQVSNLVSSISFVKLSDSSLIFETPTLQEYQTLYIGKGGEEVYSAQGNAHIYLNTHLNGDGLLNNQKTDRLLIDGDVAGKTTVHVQFIAGNQAEALGNGNAKSISIVQVSGKAAEDSFQLSSAYIVLEGLPYQYYLHAYGPSSSLGKAKISQRLVKGDGDFWDFRLESKYVQLTPNISIVPDSQLMVRNVVPQVPTYLFLPNALFHVGLMDIESQNKQLKVMRSVSSKLLKVEGSPVLSVHGYSGNYRYVSDLSKLEYGYGGDLGYKALEVDILLKTIEGTHSTTSFGIMATYGRLSLRPQDVENSQKSIFHKWLVTAYGSLESNAGFYVDGLLSYGLFKGDVVTLARGKTATLKSKPLSVSLTGGQSFATGYEGFVVDPQIQLIYQHLQFHKAHDIDRFDVEMGKLDQWAMRIGGRLTKMLAAFEKDRIVSFYGKLHVSHGFRGKQSVYFKDAFQLSAFGSSLEAGVGVYSQLSSKLILHSDLMYQHKLTKAGFSGIHFSGGLRYRF
ncbi:autotransporter [Bartonella henselae]|uniref:autotransporter family protein n=1 Tax=Bartonella henselae TaxID=38323 RepID=UPI000960DD53|nr:autotransporter outer membrane beta-barrel domain-containing protein [Bartonella henselae]OLL54747.1 autotransporter [Bartonella henselae]